MNQQEEEQTNGFDIELARNDEDCGRHVCTGCGAATRPAFSVEVPASVVTITTTILALGVVVALIYFMHLCFVYPSSASTVIPLLLTVLTWVATRWQGRRKARDTKRHTASAKLNPKD